MIEDWAAKQGETVVTEEMDNDQMAEFIVERSLILLVVVMTSPISVSST